MPFLKVLIVALAFVIDKTVSGENVLLRDLNDDHDRRNLDAGLPLVLEFSLQRHAGKNDVKLTLEENRRLNANAPVFEGQLDVNGVQRLVETNSPSLKGVGFYQDKRNGGAFMVKCPVTRSGPCRRTVSGFLAIDGSTYNLTPSPEVLTGVHIYVEVTARGVPHVLEKHGIQDDADGKALPSHTVETFADERDAGVEDNDAAKYNMDERMPQQLNNGDAHPKRSKTAELLGELRAVITADRLEKLFKTLKSRKKRATGQMACEIVVAVDTEIWGKYYSETSSTATLTQEQATELKIRERFSHIINGVSLRYESIDDADYNIYMTVSGWIIYKTRDSSNPLPLGAETQEGSIVFAQADEYISALVSWYAGLANLPHNDHVMVFTGYELYSANTSYTAVAGKAWVGAICGTHRTSVVENHDYFVTTSLAAHELGHNLGSLHDGSKDSPLSEACASTTDYIMASTTVLFTSPSQYTVNPWRFSQCSIDQFKETINTLGSDNCMLDHGDYYDVTEWNNHVQHLPGQLYDADTQCRLLYGDSSLSCTDTTSEGICLIMTCLMTDGQYCSYHTAAKGTPCGNPASNKYCIEGQCVSTSSSNNGNTAGTAPQTTQPAATTAAKVATTAANVATTAAKVATTAANVATTAANVATTTTASTPSTAARSSTAATTNTSPTSNCVDVGWRRYSCSYISAYFLRTYAAGPDLWCWDDSWGPPTGACCDFCTPYMKR